MHIPLSVIQQLPKTDLHVHLDGSLRLHSLIDLAKQHNIALPSYTEEGLCDLVFKKEYQNLGEYLQGFFYTCGVMQTKEALERVAYELAWDNIREGVRYIEVRFAPFLHTVQGLTLEEVLRSVCDGLERAKQEYNQTPVIVSKAEPPFMFGVIVCALRMFTKDTPGWYGKFRGMFTRTKEKDIFGLASLELVKEAVRCRDQLGMPIVGFDLAGQEDGYPAKHHQLAFDYAHQFFLMKTVHAGEAYGPESIFEAINFSNADRIGHGYHLFSPEKIQSDHVYDKIGYTNALIRYVANRRLTIEVCISSNMQTNPEIGTISNHHFHKMLKEKISATLCTDNRLVSHTTVSEEYQTALTHFDVGFKELHSLITYGFKRSFYYGSYIEKRTYVRQCIDYFEKVWENNLDKIQL